FFMPAAPLAVGTSYRVVVRPGVQDVAGNPLGFNVVFDFTTAFAADTTPPEVMRVDPADGDTGVPTNAEITIELSEAVDPISVTSTTVKLQQGTSVIAGTLSLLDGNRRIKQIGRASCRESV